MRPLFVIFLLLARNIAIAQDAAQLQSLKTAENNITANIKKLEDSLAKIRSRITKLQTNTFSDTVVVKPFQKAAVKPQMRIRNTIDAYSATVKHFEGTDTVFVRQYHPRGYYFVKYNNQVGWMPDYAVVETDYTKHLKQAYLDKKEAEQKRIDAKLQKDAETYKAILVKKYGQRSYQKAMDGEVWLGMPSDLAMLSMGYPDHKNTNVGSWGTHEQWVYGNNDYYLYFENGLLSSYSY